MSRLIEADKLIERLEPFKEKYGTKEFSYRLMHEAFIYEVEQEPTVDAVPVVHGRWIRDEFGTKCGVCGLYAYRDKFGQPWESPYCPNCGSRNRSEE